MNFFKYISNAYNNLPETLVILSILFIMIVGFSNIIRKQKGTSTQFFSTKGSPMNINFSRNKDVYNNNLDKNVDKNMSSGEKECKRVLEEFFNYPFRKVRPDFLKNPATGNTNLELDCYNDKLKLAVEYNGEQHYKFIPFFHKNKEAFMNQKYRDIIKAQICKDHGITLIEVPYTVKLNNIRTFLLHKLKEKGYIN